MMTKREQLLRVIAHLETQRELLGDESVDASIVALRRQIAALTPSQSEERKLVTVLFADVSGFTSMSESMDAEEVRDTMNALWQRLDSVIRKYGGTIDKHLGDGVMALFGTPTAREDDAERAVRSALEMQSAVKEFATSSTAPNLQMRIGINTGTVLLGNLGTTGEYTAIGDAVNVASRLEEASPIGGILVSYSTYRLVRGVFQVQVLEPIVVRGKADPVQVYLIEALKPHAFHIKTRGIEGIDTRMIGRDGELKLLQDMMMTVLEDRESGVVSILGEAGIGKSRLLYEFDQWLDSLPQFVQFFGGRATEEMRNLPYSLLRDMLSDRFDIQDSDSPTEVRQKLEIGIEGLIHEESVAKAHYIGQLVGFDFSPDPQFKTTAEHLQSHGVNSLIELFSEAAQTYPVVIYLEDVHWADESSLEIVKYFINAALSLPLLVICLARPTLLERYPIWGKNHTMIQLRPLAKRDTKRLIQEILRQLPEVPNVLIEKITKVAEGNPYYVEEIIKMLIDESILVKSDSQWRIRMSRLQEVRVPPTLTGVIQARLDSLSPIEQIVLQRAAVIGKSFWGSAIAYMYTDEQNTLPEIEAALQLLCEKDMIEEDESHTFAGVKEYRFKHNILRDVTYERVLRRVRRQYHTQVAAWLITNSGERVNEYMYLIAEHYVHAGQASQAVDFLTRAGEQALLVSAYREAANFFERALAMTDGLDAKPPQAYILRQLGEIHWRLGEYEKAKHLLETSAKYYQELEDQIGYADALSHLGVVSLGLGEYASAKRHLESSLSTSATLNDKHGIARSLDGLGNIALALGEYESAREYLKKSLPIAREIGDRWRTATSLNNLGLVAQHLGELDEAKQQYQESLQIFRDMGNRWGIAVALDSLGDVAAELGLIQDAYQHFREGLTTAIEISAMPVALSCLAGFAKLHIKTNQPDKAAELLSLVLNHPTKDREVDERAVPLLGIVQGLLSPEKLAETSQRGKTLDFDKKVIEILDEFA